MGGSRPRGGAAAGGEVGKDAVVAACRVTDGGAEDRRVEALVGGQVGAVLETSSEDEEELMKGLGTVGSPENTESGRTSAQP